MCHPHNATLIHGCMVDLARLNKAGYHTLHGRAIKQFKHKMPLIMMGMHCWHKRWARESLCAGPTQAMSSSPNLKLSCVSMQRALRGCNTKGPGCHNPAGHQTCTYVERVVCAQGHVPGHMSTISQGILSPTSVSKPPSGTKGKKQICAQHQRQHRRYTIRLIRSDRLAHQQTADGSKGLLRHRYRQLLRHRPSRSATLILLWKLCKMTCQRTRAAVAEAPCRHEL